MKLEKDFISKNSEKILMEQDKKDVKEEKKESEIKDEPEKTTENKPENKPQNKTETEPQQTEQNKSQKPVSVPVDLKPKQLGYLKGTINSENRQQIV